MTADPLAALADLPGVAEAAAAARGAVDGLLWDRRLPRRPDVAATARILSAHACAALDGADLKVAEVAHLASVSAPGDSAMTRAVLASLRVQAELPALVSVWSVAPLQALARLASIAGRGFVPDENLGRPREGEQPDDPLRLGPAPAPAEVAVRLEQLARLVTAPTGAPAVVVAGVVHAEVAVLRPFDWGSGYVARAAGRLVLAARGVDPDLLAVPDAGLLAGGRPGYVSALKGYARGGAGPLGLWLRGYAEALRLGVSETVAVLDSDPGAALRGR